jgi:hypothetical protein
MKKAEFSWYTWKISALSRGGAYPSSFKKFNNELRLIHKEYAPCKGHIQFL